MFEEKDKTKLHFIFAFTIMKRKCFGLSILVEIYFYDSKKGLLPSKLVTFLNAMSVRHFLETDGATWRFRHKILQDYFAKAWEEHRGKSKINKSNKITFF